MRKRSKSWNGLLGAIFLELAALVGIFAIAQPARLMKWVESHAERSRPGGTSNPPQEINHPTKPTTVAQSFQNVAGNPMPHRPDRRPEATQRSQPSGVSLNGTADPRSLPHGNRSPDTVHAHQENASNVRLVEQWKRKFRPPAIASFPSITAANY